jgi:hypothetical protein
MILLFLRWSECVRLLERKFDSLLQVKTSGLREWKDGSIDYHRYEATPYAALEKLFRHYKVQPTDHIVDFGSGKGRVSFFMHYHFNVPVTGVEMNDLTFEESQINKALYTHKNRHLTAPIHFEFGLAEQYEIQPEENVFYFFNPFSVTIFKHVVRNILQSVKQHPRSIDLILYYPLPDYKKFLKKKTPFKIMNKVKAYKKHGRHGKFIIYRLT